MKARRCKKEWKWRKNHLSDELAVFFNPLRLRVSLLNSFFHSTLPPQAALRPSLPTAEIENRLSPVAPSFFGTLCAMPRSHPDFRICWNIGGFFYHF